MPVMRTMWMEYPNDEKTFSIDDQWLIGSDLLVKPITRPGATSSHLMVVYLPSQHVWYDADTMTAAVVDNQNLSFISCAIDKIPVFQRGGTMISRKLRLRRSTEMMKTDPFTLYIAVDAEYKANGNLYLDDEHSFDFQRGHYGSASFAIEDFVLSNKYSSSTNYKGKGGEIERIVIMGMPRLPARVYIEDKEQSEMMFSYDEKTQILVMRKADVIVYYDWKISLEVN